MSGGADPNSLAVRKKPWGLVALGVILLFLAGFGAISIVRRVPWPAPQAATEAPDAAPSAFIEERGQPEFAADPQYERASAWAAAARLDSYPVLENVNVGTGAKSSFRELARGVVRVDTLYETGGGAGEGQKPIYGVVVCSGFLASAAIVVTARHCVDNPPEGYGLAKLKAARVVLDYLRDGDRTASTLQIDVTPGSIILGKDSGRAGDYALLRISAASQPEVSEDRVLQMAPAEDMSGQNLFILHHPLGRPLHLTQAGCRSGDEEANGVLQHTCLTFGGSSGAPVFSQVSLRVVGIHVAGDEERGRETANRGYFVPLRLLWPELEEATGRKSELGVLPGAPVWPVEH